MMLKVHLNNSVYRSDFEAFFKKSYEIHILKARQQSWVGFFFQSFPLSPLPFHPPQFILQERYYTKKPLKWIVWEILPLANNKAHFFPKSSNYWSCSYKILQQFFFFLPFQLVMSDLSVLGNDFSYLSSEFLLICRAHVAEIMHVKWRCRKQLLSDVCCAVILLSEFHDKPFWICGL